MTETSLTVAETLARRAIALRAEDIPAEVRDRCRDLLVDVAGLCVAARNNDYVLALKRSLDAGGACSALGHAGGYSAEDAAWWSEKLHRKISPGFFGENLTITRWWPGLRVGDRLQSGSLVLEITFPRIPCATLAARVGDPKFLKAFVKARRSGAYARVSVPGPIAAGDRFVLIAAPESFPTMEAMFDLWHAKTRNKGLLRRILEAPIAERARAAVQRWLATP